MSTFYVHNNMLSLFKDTCFLRCSSLRIGLSSFCCLSLHVSVDWNTHMCLHFALWIRKL